MSKEELENIELIEAYVEGRLSEEEILKVEARMSADQEFREEVELYKTLVSGIKSTSEIRIKHKLSQIDAELDGGTGSSSFLNQSWGIKLAIAASIAVVVIGFSYWMYDNSYSSERVFAKYYVKDPGLPALMSSSSNKLLDEAMHQYKIGNYENSILILERIKSEIQSNDTIIYFLGICYLMDDSPEVAIKYFKDVPASSSFNSAAKYNLAVCMYLLDNKSDARAIFKEIAKDKSSPYFESSTQFLND